MSLDKAIKSGREWRKKSKGCSRGRVCDWCTLNRQYANRKRLMKARHDQKEVLQEVA